MLAQMIARPVPMERCGRIVGNTKVTIGPTSDPISLHKKGLSRADSSP